MNRITSGRPCATCSHDRRAEIEGALVTGESVSGISGRFGGHPSTSSIYRHISLHLSPELREGLQGLSQSGLTDILARISRIGTLAQEAAEDAYSRGDTTNAIRAGDAAVRAHVVLAARFGLDDQDILSMLAEAQALARAVKKISRSDPAYAQALVDALRTVGADSLADDLESVFSGEARSITT
jgi:hypothetical protein